MFLEKRRREVPQLVKEHGQAGVTDLSQTFRQGQIKEKWMSASTTSNLAPPPDRIFMGTDRAALFLTIEPLHLSYLNIIANPVSMTPAQAQEDRPKRVVQVICAGETLRPGSSSERPGGNVLKF